MKADFSLQTFLTRSWFCLLPWLLEVADPICSILRQSGFGVGVTTKAGWSGEVAMSFISGDVNLEEVELTRYIEWLSVQLLLLLPRGFIPCAQLCLLLLTKPWLVFTTNQYISHRIHCIFEKNWKLQKNYYLYTVESKKLAHLNYKLATQLLCICYLIKIVFQKIITFFH